MSTRIKDDDPQIERAYAFADVMTAARQPHYMARLVRKNNGSLIQEKTGTKKAAK